MRGLILVAAMLVAGCGEQAEAPVNEAAAQAEANATGNVVQGENALAQVLAMNDRQRNVVFIRALMDAGIACQSVESSARLPDQDGKPLWRANCPGGVAHMITITPDGTANIVSRTDR